MCLRDWSRSGGSYGNNTRVISKDVPTGQQTPRCALGTSLRRTTNHSDVFIVPSDRLRSTPIMEPRLSVPICRDMQFWWDKPPIPSPRKCMPTETCFGDVGRICACVMWTQMYVTLQTRNVFHLKAVIILFLINQPICIILFVTYFNIEEII